MSCVFYLKKRDTRPILEVELHDPPPLGSADGTVGPVHDLTTATSVKLHIWLSDGTKLVRDMEIDDDPETGIVTYTWLASDWDTASSDDGNGSYQVGGLVVGPTIPVSTVPSATREHRMEYEVHGPSGARLTFPNSGYDTLRILADVGQ